MADKSPQVEPTNIRCWAVGHVTDTQSYLSITRTNGTTERFWLTPTHAASGAMEFTSLNYKWNRPDAA